MVSPPPKKHLFFEISTNKIIFFRNETSIVNLELIRNDEKVQHVVYGQDYTLRAHISQPDGQCLYFDTMKPNQQYHL